MTRRVNFERALIAIGTGDSQALLSESVFLLPIANSDSYLRNVFLEADRSSLKQT